MRRHRTLRNIPAAAALFRKDGEGNVAIFFALASIPAMLTLGAGIDYARGRAEQIQLQQGADAAALAGLQSVHKGVILNDAQGLIQQVLRTNDNNPSATVTKVSLSADGSTLCVTAASVTKTTLMAIGGIPSINIGAYACSKTQIDTFEIALAIDNSGSMNNSAGNGQSKLQSAIKAAEGLIIAMSPSSGVGVPVNFSLVPFSLAVNVGPQYANAAWMDTQAQSSIHWQNYLRPTDKNGKPISGLPKSRFEMFANIGTTWAGCVEERPSPFTTTDVNASESPDALFVPFLAPDEFDSKTSVNTYLGDETGACTKDDIFDSWDKSFTWNMRRPGRGDGQTKLCKYMLPSTTRTFHLAQVCSPIPVFPYTFCSLQMVPDDSVSSQGWYGTDPSTGTDGYGGKSTVFLDYMRDPTQANAGCKSRPLTTLTSSTDAIRSGVDAMSAAGDTQLLAGFMWAWRTLSPKGPFSDSRSLLAPVGSVLTGSKTPLPYDFVASNGARNHKVIILLTDGMNHWSGEMENTSAFGFVSKDPNKSVYNSLGFFGDNRLGPTNANNARPLMDSATLQACTNAKLAGVEVYTVGLLATDGIDNAGRLLLKNCASDMSHTYVAADGDALISVFQQIATALVKPRLSR